MGSRENIRGGKLAGTAECLGGVILYALIPMVASAPNASAVFKVTMAQMGAVLGFWGMSFFLAKRRSSRGNFFVFEMLAMGVLRAVMTALFFSAMSIGPSAQNNIITLMWPIAALIVDGVFLSGKTSASTWSAVLVCAAGAILVVTNGDFSDMSGLHYSYLLSAGYAVLAAVYNLWYRSAKGRRFPGENELVINSEILKWNYLVVFACSLTFFLNTGERLEFSWEAAGFIAAGLIGYFLAQMLTYSSLSKLTLGNFSAIRLSNPAISTLILCWYTGNFMGVWSVFGCLVSIAGMALASTFSRNG